MISTRHHLAEIIGKHTLAVKDQSKLVRSIAAYLLEEGQVDNLEPLMRDVMEYRAEHGIVEGTLISAHGLSDAVKADITKMLKHELVGSKTIVIDEKIDPEIIGGIRVDLPGEQLDATLAAKLNLFKRLTAQERN